MKHKILDILRRLLILLLVVWTVVSLVTLLIELVPGDPANIVLGDAATPEAIEDFRRKHGLDKPAFFFSLSDERGAGGFRWHGWDNRYVEYWRGILHADMGRSFRTDCPVTRAIFYSRCFEETGRTVPWGERLRGFLNSPFASTAQLAVAALLVAVSIAIPLGVVAGKNRGRLLDNILSVVALVGISLPSFVIGPFLIYIFAVWLGWVDPSGRFGVSSIILPAVTLGAALSALLTRMVRSSVIEELGEDYVRTARAKGLSESKVVYKHVLKNGLIPVVTVLGLEFGSLIAFSVVTETIFAWPGMGKLLIDAIIRLDRPLIVAYLMMIVLMFIVINLMVDVLYSLLDPRVRLQEQGA